MRTPRDTAAWFDWLTDLRERVLERVRGTPLEDRARRRLDGIDPHGGRDPFARGSPGADVNEGLRRGFALLADAPTIPPFVSYATATAAPIPGAMDMT